MRIWLVSIFEQTPVDNVFSTRFLSIADEAVKRGHDITFIGSTFKHNTKNQRFEDTKLVVHGPSYRLLFIKSKDYQKNISIKRLWSHYVFSKVALRELDRLEKPDIILMAYPPITLTNEVSKWAKKNDVPVIMDIIDPWPDTFTKAMPSFLRPIGEVFLTLMKYKLKSTLKNLSALTAISKQYIDWSHGYYKDVPRYEVLYPAADFEATRSLIEKHFENENGRSLNIIYAGSLASSYDIPCILEAARLLKDYTDIHFYIAGTGPQQHLIENYVKDNSNLTYLGRLPKNELVKYYAKSDLGLTQHVYGASQSVTYKLFDLLASGLPVLNSLESEMKDIILENQVGLHNEPGNAEQLRDNVLYFYQNDGELSAYKDRGLKLAETVGDTKVIYSKFVDLLEGYGNSANLH